MIFAFFFPFFLDVSFQIIDEGRGKKEVSLSRAASLFLLRLSRTTPVECFSDSRAPRASDRVTESETERKLYAVTRRRQIVSRETDDLSGKPRGNRAVLRARSAAETVTHSDAPSAVCRENRRRPIGPDVKNREQTVCESPETWNLPRYMPRCSR